MKRDSPLALVFAAAVIFLGTGATKAQPESVLAELNKLESRSGSCLAYLLLENRSSSAFATLKLDVVVFDTEGIVTKRLAVEAAPLPLEKTSLKVFEMEDLPCERVGRVLLNEIMTCADESRERGDCLLLISTGSRGPVPFIK